MRTLKVLLVDDEVEFVSTLSERLAIRGIDTKTAFDAEEALTLIEADAPDVLVADITLPGTSGNELLKLVKEEHPHMEVILITGGDVSTRERIEAMRLGAFDYLLKPFSIEELEKKLRMAVAYPTKGERTR